MYAGEGGEFLLRVDRLVGRFTRLDRGGERAGR